MLATTVLAPGQGITESAPLFAADRDADVPTVDVCVSYKNERAQQLENRYTMTFAEASRLGSADPLTEAVKSISRTMHKWSSTGDRTSLTVETRDARHDRFFGRPPESATSPQELADD